MVPIWRWKKSRGGACRSWKPSQELSPHLWAFLLCPLEGPWRKEIKVLLIKRLNNFFSCRAALDIFRCTGPGPFPQEGETVPKGEVKKLKIREVIWIAWNCHLTGLRIKMRVCHWLNPTGMPRARQHIDVVHEDQPCRAQNSVGEEKIWKDIRKLNSIIQSSVLWRKPQTYHNNITSVLEWEKLVEGIFFLMQKQPYTTSKHSSVFSS